MDQIEQMTARATDAHLDTPTFSQIAGRATTTTTNDSIR
jgi:hypothetical protein